MNGSMARAWQAFDRAAAHDEKRVAAGKAGDVRKARQAKQLADKYLDEALALEAQAVGEPEVLAA